jgi:hypothetical protein
LASPLTFETFIQYNLPVYPGAQGDHSMRDKPESSNLETSEQSLPFFARFLEGHDTSTTSFQTLKYPSDRDEIEWNPVIDSNR